MQPLDYRTTCEGLAGMIIHQQTRVFWFLATGTYTPFEKAFWSVSGHTRTAIQATYARRGR